MTSWRRLRIESVHAMRASGYATRGTKRSLCRDALTIRQFSKKRLDEIERETAERTVIDVKRVACARAKRTRKRAAEDDVAGIQVFVVRRDLVREPRDARRRVIEHGGR